MGHLHILLLSTYVYRYFLTPFMYLLFEERLRVRNAILFVAHTVWGWLWRRNATKFDWGFFFRWRDVDNNLYLGLVLFNEKGKTIGMSREEKGQDVGVERNNILTKKSYCIKFCKPILQHASEFWYGGSLVCIDLQFFWPFSSRKERIFMQFLV